MKFGGTSVGTVQSLTNVKEIVGSSRGPVAVIVSALGGVTDMLIKGAGQALEGDDACHLTWREIECRHSDVVFSTLVDEDKQQELWQKVSRLMSLLQDYYTGIFLLRDLSERTLCNVVSLGERMSSLIISYILADCTLLDSMEMIKTERWCGKNIADSALTDSLIREAFGGVKTRVALCPGFISRDKTSGDVTNLGRGGSDYTAALIAASLGAEVLDIWTDVDGFLTADPRIIKEAQVIPHLSFLESMDLCNFGAKVIYPPTIYPVFHKNIPIRILNTFRPQAPGTVITDAHKASSLHEVRGVTSIAECSVITVVPSESFPSPALHTRTLGVLSKQGVEILLHAPGQQDGSISMAMRRTDASRAMQALREDFASEGKADVPAIIESTEVSTVSAVGEGVKRDPRAKERLGSMLEQAGIKVIASAIGASGFTLSFVVPQENHHEALSVLHTLSI